MSDYTSASVEVTFSEPWTVGQSNKFEQVLGQWGPDDTTPNTDKELWAQFYELRVGDVENVFDTLRETFPDAAEIVAWEDPKYEWLGQIFRWKRGRESVFSASCDADGQVVVTETEIRKAFAADDPLDALRRAIGDEHEGVLT